MIRGESMANRVGHFINNQRTTDSVRWGNVFNPATGEIIRQVALADQDDVELAVDAAYSAFPDWAATPPLQVCCDRSKKTLKLQARGSETSESTLFCRAPSHILITG